MLFSISSLALRLFSRLTPQLFLKGWTPHQRGTTQQSRRGVRYQEEELVDPDMHCNCLGVLLPYYIFRGYTGNMEKKMETMKIGFRG